MLLKYLGSIIPAQEGENKVVAIAWSPNNLRLAVASSDRAIYLFDEKGARKDKFYTKPVDSKNGKKSYVIKGIAFSPDSTKIAVGQTDNIIYVYRIGEDWGEKKIICNKFSQSAAVTCLVWPSEGPIVVGLADGKVRAALLKTNKGHTLYGSDSMTISLAVNVKGTGFLSGHADGSIIRYYVTEDSQSEPAGRVVTHRVPPYALAWPLGHVLAGGSDKRITLYDHRGKVVKNFDYGRDQEERELTSACCSPSGQSVAVGSWNKVRLLDWSPRRSVWEEANTRTLPNLYTVTAMAWRRDGSRLVVGGLCGAVEQFESVLRRTVVRGSHEVAYVGPSQVVVRPLNGSSRSVVIRSQTGSEIEDVRVLGRKDNHIVARTATTLLVSDIELNLLSEIPWDDKGGTEKFFFEYPGVCLIFCAGELTIVEYGSREVLGSVRTEAVNPHVVSIRINERHVNEQSDNKRLAYLLDPRTICVIDLITSATICSVLHDARVDWLELSETGQRLLSRDRRGRLWLSDDQGERTLLLAGTNFASWVTGSDVVVAQTGHTLAVWYNVDAPEAATLIPIKGDAVDVIRENGQTLVIVEEATGRVSYVLDESLIEFGTALHDNDFGRVVLFLEELGDRPQAEAMWENVAQNAMGARKFGVAARCYAALGDVACSNLLCEIVAIGEKYSTETGNNGLSSPDVWAKIAILNGELKTAEAIYLEQNELDKALEMYKKYWHWEDALSLAQNRGWDGLDELKDKHLRWLLESEQAARAGAIVESDDPRRAVSLYLDARCPGRAARLVLANDDLIDDNNIVRKVVASLKEADLMELAGELLERSSSDPSSAIKCYAEARVFARALELARKLEPSSVVSLEKEWGQDLALGGHYDAAINHFIEAGETALALDAAIKAHQWRKALQIIQVIEDDDPAIQKQCGKLAEYYASISDRQMAETLFIRAGSLKRAIDMHIQSGEWEQATRVAMDHLNIQEAKEILRKHAEALHQAGDLRQAEALYIAIDEYDSAIAMYRHAGHRGDMVRIVRKYRPELLQATHAHLARELEAAGKPREAEEHFLGNGDWRGAAAAYRAANMWEDALRVAKQGAGEKAAHQVALMWARTLAPEMGARLLMRLDCFQACLQLACDANFFDWALDIARYGTAEQKKEVYYRHAMALEDEGRFGDAEKEFIMAGKAMEAVQMYIHTQDWDAAEEVARSHYPDGLPQVLVSRAAVAAEAQDYALAESLLLRAHKPEIIVDHYKKAGMWSEAMRVCREYLPSQEAALRRELTQANSGPGIPGSSGNLEEARRWLESGEVRAALDILILDPQASKAALIEAGDILIHQADPDTACQIGENLGTRLFALGEHALAAQVFLQADKLKNAVDALAAVGEWGRAKRIVRELAPELENYLEEKYKEAMIREGQVDQLVHVDAEAALDILAHKGQWNQVFETAIVQDRNLLHKYVAQRAAQLMKSGSFTQALQLYVQYDAPPLPQNYNLYCHISETILSSEGSCNDYKYLSQLRNLLLRLVRSMELKNDETSKLEKFLQAAHFCALRTGCEEFPQLFDVAMKTSVSLLRYSNLLPADRCYYDAGSKARTAGRCNEAFVFFNHFLDLQECIEENDGGLLDVEDLKATDFPLEVPLPTTLSFTPEQREEVREWVLAVSMDQRIEQGLPIDQRGVYIGSLTSPSNNSGILQACILTGYPIRGPVINFEGSHHVADRDDWNKLVSTARQSPQDSLLNDILMFVQDLCGTVPNFIF